MFVSLHFWLPLWQLRELSVMLRFTGDNVNQKTHKSTLADPIRSIFASHGKIWPFTLNQRSQFFLYETEMYYLWLKCKYKSNMQWDLLNSWSLVLQTGYQMHSYSNFLNIEVYSMFFHLPIISCNLTLFKRQVVVFFLISQHLFDIV